MSVPDLAPDDDDDENLLYHYSEVILTIFLEKYISHRAPT